MRVSEKWEAAVPLSVGDWGAGSHPTQCDLGRGLPLYQVALIHATIWPQYTNVTDRQDMTTVQ